MKFEKFGTNAQNIINNRAENKLIRLFENFS